MADLDEALNRMRLAVIRRLPMGWTLQDLRVVSGEVRLAAEGERMTVRMVLTPRGIGFEAETGPETIPAYGATLDEAVDDLLWQITEATVPAGRA